MCMVFPCSPVCIIILYIKSANCFIDCGFINISLQSSVLDEDDRDFKRTRKPTEEIEEKPILTINRDYHSSYKAKKRRVESDHDSGARIKHSKHNISDDIKSEMKVKMKDSEEEDDIKEEESSREEDEDHKKSEDISEKKDDDEQSSEQDKSEKKRESSSG